MNGAPEPRHTVTRTDRDDMIHPFSRTVPLLAAVCCIVAACGGGGSEAGSDGASGANPPPTPSDGTVTLAWDANSESDMAGYRVYYGTSSGTYQQARGGGINAGLATEFSITGLQPGTTYYMTVTSYDRSGNESNYSAQVSGVAR
jgi:hypothetical protein